MRERNQSPNQERRRRQMSSSFSDWDIEDDYIEDKPHRAQNPSQRREAVNYSMQSPQVQARRQAQSQQASRSQNRTSAGRAQGGQDPYARQSGRAQDPYARQSSRTQGGQNQYARQASRAQGGQDQYARQASRAQDQYARQSGRNQEVYGHQSMGGYGGDDRNPHDDYQRKPKNQRKNKHTVGKVLAAIQGLLSLAVLAILFILDVLPMMYLGLIAGVLVLLWVFTFFSQFTKRSHVPGKVFSVLISGLLIFGGYYLLITQNMLAQITNFTYNIDNMIVVVLKDDPAQSLQDAAGYTFGIRSNYDGESVTHTIEEINKTVETKIATQDFESLESQVQALYNGQVGAIIYNENMKGSIEEIYPDFSIDTRTLENVEIKTKVEVQPSADVSVTEDPFIIYVSGNDGYGQLSIKGRSDVNMLVAIHPKTKQILMVNTPRDFYVEFPGVTNGYKDKLTHSGNYGIECTMDTLASVYGYNPDYYVRVNFSSLIKMVDALGGVTVNSDYDFTAIDGRHYNAGPNTLDGESALMFARERKNLPGGDFQRGRNQQLLLTAMLNKAMSPAILTSYAGLMSSLQDSFATNMSSDDITELIKQQLSDGGTWNIVTTAASGTPDMQPCYSLSDAASVVIPDQASVEACKTMLDQLFNGEILQQPDVAIQNVN